MGAEVFVQRFGDVKHEVQVVGHYDGGTNAEGRHFHGQESKLAGNGFAERVRVMEISELFAGVREGFAGVREGFVGAMCEKRGRCFSAVMVIR